MPLRLLPLSSEIGNSRACKCAGLPKQSSLASLTSSGRLAQEMAATIDGRYEDSDDESDWDRYSYGEAEHEVGPPLLGVSGTDSPAGWGLTVREYSCMHDKTCSLPRPLPRDFQQLQWKRL